MAYEDLTDDLTKNLPLDYSDVTQDYGVEQNPVLEDVISEEHMLNLSKSHEENLKSLQSTTEPDATRTSYGDVANTVAAPTEEYVTWNKERTASIYKNIKDDIMDGAINGSAMAAISEGLKKQIELYPNNPANAYAVPIIDLIESSKQNAKSITDEIVDGFLDRGEKLFEDVQSTRGLGKKYLQERYPDIYDAIYNKLPQIVKDQLSPEAEKDFYNNLKNNG